MPNLQTENLSSQCDSLVSIFFSLAIEVKASKHCKLLLTDSMVVTIGIQEDTERPYYSWLVPTYPAVDPAFRSISMRFPLEWRARFLFEKN